MYVTAPSSPWELTTLAALAACACRACAEAACMVRRRTLSSSPSTMRISSVLVRTSSAGFPSAPSATGSASPVDHPNAGHSSLQHGT